MNNINKYNNGGGRRGEINVSCHSVPTTYTSRESSRTQSEVSEESWPPTHAVHHSASVRVYTGRASKGLQTLSRFSHSFLREHHWGRGTGRKYAFHFVNRFGGRTDTQRGDASCPRSHRDVVGKSGRHAFKGFKRLRITSRYASVFKVHLREDPQEASNRLSLGRGTRAGRLLFTHLLHILNFLCMCIYF